MGMMAHDDLIMAAFRKFDPDNSGEIDCEELTAMFGDQLSEEEVKEMIAEADFHKNGKITYQDFVKYLQSGKAADSHIEAAHSMVDTHVEQSGVHSESGQAKKCRMKGDKDQGQGQDDNTGLFSCCMSRDDKGK